MNKFRYFIFSFLLIICLGAVKRASAQGILPGFSATMNVDNLSDDQIRQLMAQVQAAGLSDDQLLQMAPSRGVSTTQIQRYQVRVAEIRKKDATTASGTNGNEGAPVIRQLNDRDTSQTRLQNKTEALKINGTVVFGSNLFSGASNTFEPNLKLPTPKNYIVGPDDQIVINIYGNNVANWTLPVSLEGNINIPNIGIVNVTGKTIEQVTQIIRNKLITHNFSIGKGTEFQINLGNIRTIKVIMQGEFVKPGTFNITSLATVFNAISVAGGPNNIGSYRNIDVIRNGKVVSHMDLYDFLLRGSQKGNIALQDQDIILVPTYDIRIELKGEVKRPALFETLPGETLQDLINYAGGFTDLAYTAHIKVTEVNGEQRKLKDVFADEYKTYIPKRGDRYTVDRILDRFENRVTIKGAVFRPNDYELQDGLTLSKLIKNAGGIKEDAFTSRASLIRLNPDNSTKELSFNVVDVLANKPGADVILQREDIVTISSKFDLRDQYKVTIHGEVRKPGDFAYADSMKVADLIIRANGFTEGASTKRLEVSRRVFDSDPRNRESKVADVFSININGDLKEGEGDFTLKPYDIVSIYSQPGYEIQKTVKVEGEVIYPGPYTILKKNEKISDIIARAGGLTGSADVDGANLMRDNSAVVSTDKTKIDTTELNKEHDERLKRIQRTYKDSTNVTDAQSRNNYVGIDLKKILQTPGIEEDLILENGDVLRIPKQLQTVKVNGEVLFPSAIVYQGGKTLKGYVLNAGGFSPNALKNSSYVVYSNGTVKGTRRFLFFVSRPQIKPGSEIYVPKVPPKKDNLPEVLALLTSLVSMAAIIFGIISLHK